MNDTEVSIRFDNKVSGEKKLEKYAEQLKIINSVLSGLDAGKMKQIDGSASDVKTISKNVGDIKNKTSAAFDYLKITKYYGAIKKLGSAISSLSKKSMDYFENFNLFQVAFNGNYDSAQRFINKMTEMYGLDESWLTQTIGKFKQLTNAMDLTAETGEKVSELLTQMSLDISSLYNVDIDKASQTLMSAMAGQTKPIRGVTGADITQGTLQKTLDSMGIDRAVAELSYAEKRLLIIISLTDQLNASIGDMGRTIESPANQMRILNEQWERLTRAVGNLFLPILSKILPYLNAILMVLTEIIKCIASLLGFNQDDFDYFDKPTANLDKFNSGLEKGTKNAKKLKQGLRGFDKLNVITSPSKAGGSGGTGGGIGGIDPKIFKGFDKAYKDYQKKLKNIKMRATEIRDQIMEWLGFTKVVDKKTKEVSFKFDHITGGTVLGALAVGGVIFSGITKIFGLLRRIGLLKFPIIEKVFGKIFGLGKAKDGISGAAGLGDTVKEKSSSFKLPSIKTVLKGLAEIAIVIGGLTLLVTAIGAFMKIPHVKDAASTGIAMIVEMFTGIGKIFIPLALVTAGMVGLGMLGGSGVAAVALGLADLAIVIAGTAAIVTAIGAFMLIDGVNQAASTGMDVITKIFEGIGDILVPLGIVSVGLLALGLIGASGGTVALAVGLVALAEVVGGLAIVVAAMGKVSEMKFVKNNLDNGINLMIKLFGGIGKIIGAIIGNIVAEVIDSIGKTLPNLGTYLSQFMENASYFFDNINKVNKNATEGIKDLATAILILTANNVINGLTSWFAGDMSLADFGKQLSEFAPDFVKFTKSIDKLSESSINKAKIVGSIMTEIIKFAKEIPNSGGVAGWFMGENDLADFSKHLPKFAKNMTDFAKNIGSINKSVVSQTENIKDAMLNIIEFAKKIPNDGGVAGWFAGDNNIGDFGKNLKNFGSSFKDYANNIKGISVDKVNSVTTAISKIIDLAISIKKNGLGKTISDFASDLKDAGKNITDFFDKTLTKDKGKKIGENFGGAIADAIANKIKNKSFPSIKITDSSNNSKVTSYKIDAYAKGGLPPVGQLFLANEKGPELVGQVGGQSFVANQNQVLDLIDSKLRSSSASINPTIIVQVGNKEIAKQVITDLQDMAKTNGRPITIGG